MLSTRSGVVSPPPAHGGLGEHAREKLGRVYYSGFICLAYIHTRDLTTVILFKEG